MAGRMLKKVKRGLVAAAALVVAVVVGWFVYRTVKTAEYQRELVAAGFPIGYAERLAVVRFEHPTWVFERVEINDMRWDEIIARECEPALNLIVYADWATGRWNALKEKNYTPYYAKGAKAYDSGSWYQASREAIAYFMDPRNFLNPIDIFMFETLGFDADSQTKESVERTLANTFMAKCMCDGSGGRTYSEVLMLVGKSLKVSPVFLAGRLASEQGKGSPQAFGTIGEALVAYSTNCTGKVGAADIWGQRFTANGAETRKVLEKGAAAYNGFYNFYNFRAYGRGLFEIKYNAWVEATAKETCQKYDGPWNTPFRAIAGGARKIKERYVDTCRHTRYFQKFSVLPQAGAFRWKQYMQNMAAPLVEARNTYEAYNACGSLEAPYRFLIPVYRSMPIGASRDPANGKSVYSSTR